MADDYVTSSELKATLELSGQTFADDDLSLAITAASRAIDNVTGRRFYADDDATSIRYYTPRNPDRLWIDDLVTLTTLERDDGTGLFAESWTVNTDFVLEPLNAAADGWPFTSVKVRPRSGRYFWLDDRTVKVTGKFGWAEVPDTIKQAAKIIAAKLAKRSREAPFGVIGVGVEGLAVSIAENDPDVALLIGEYVRVNMGDR